MASGLTTNLQIPYPLSTDVVDVANDIKILAETLEVRLLARASLDGPVFTNYPSISGGLSAISPSDNSNLLATTAYVKSQGYATTTLLNDYAKKASPTFTGTITHLEGLFRGSQIVGTVSPVNTVVIGGATKQEEYISLSDSFGGTLALGRQSTGPWTPRIDFRTSGTSPTSVDSRITASGGDGTLGSGILTVSGKFVLSASTASRGPLNIPQGTAPSSPSNGDIWTTTAGVFARTNGVTVGPLGVASSYGSGTPSTTTVGALWVDSISHALKVYNGTAWASASGTLVPAEKTDQVYTPTLADANSFIRMNYATLNFFTIPQESEVNYPIGTKLTIMQSGTGQTSIITSGGFLLTSASGNLLRTTGSVATAIKVASPNAWVLYGDTVEQV